MYRTYPNLVLGFHGCEVSIAKKLVSNPQIPFQPSENDYDWLGSGMYFWEGNEERALEYATERLARHRSRAKPAVVGAILSLGRCLNLMEKYHLDEVAATYSYMEELFNKEGLDMPVNDGGKDNLLRKLDCAVIQLHHELYYEFSDSRYDSVRSIFTEGGELYPDAGFTKKAHIQIAIRNPNCIKGFFWPRALNDKYLRV